MSGNSVRGVVGRVLLAWDALLLRLRDERGQGLIEYGFIVVIIAVAMILLVTVIGKQTANMYSNISNSFNGH